MGTKVCVGPRDHGRPVEFDELEGADYQPGYKYEIIDGRWYVSPEAGLPHDRDEKWIYYTLLKYSWQRPDILKYVTNKARVFVPGSPNITAPEPDVAAYDQFPEVFDPSVNWEDVSPSLVNEVMGDDGERKDLVRNVELFWRVPSILEYWVLDIRRDPAQPTLRVHRRQADRWQIIDVGFGAVYTTPVLPGFELLLDPRIGA